MFLPKFLGGSRLSGKFAWGGPPILGFIAFLLTSFSKICLGGAVSYPPSPLPLPVCIYGLEQCFPNFLSSRIIKHGKKFWQTTKSLNNYSADHKLDYC